MKTEIANKGSSKEASSAWNRAGTWEDKTLKKPQLQKILESLFINANLDSPLDDSIVFGITVTEGEASIIMVRGKVKVGYEFSVEIGVGHSRRDYYSGRYEVRDYIYSIVSTIILLAILYPFCVYFSIDVEFLYDTNSEFFRTSFYRYNVNTQYISLGNLFYQTIVYAFGWLFIRRVNQRDMRPFSELLKKHGSYDSFFKLLGYSVVFFLTSGVVILGHRYDYSGYCADDHEIPVAHTITKLNDVGCRLLTEQEVIQQNFYTWTIATVVGLQFTHLSRSKLFGDFDFEGNFLSYWPLRNYFILVAVVGFSLYVLVVLNDLYIFVHAFYFYTAIFVASLAILFALIQFVFGIDRFHLHHYVIAQYILVFSCFQTPLITWINGYVTGMMIDGGASFDWDPLFEDPQDMNRYKDKTLRLSQPHPQLNSANPSLVQSSQIYDSLNIVIV
ncbi:UNKNOWN [Stylonychia lemnae]|uniref:Uncharacterized protein n=1 Tax=Stylonychia lemnae TaxID=5949 RepID=A0A078A547_STYLE|nr:UNKNOWN [Stylonychia lemnae]|eukprot:CDW76705.1 UNKNOWN [Stylonychia lemnae]